MTATPADLDRAETLVMLLKSMRLDDTVNVVEVSGVLRDAIAATPMHPTSVSSSTLNSASSGSVPSGSVPSGSVPSGSVSVSASSNTFPVTGPNSVPNNPYGTMGAPVVQPYTYPAPYTGAQGVQGVGDLNLTDTDRQLYRDVICAVDPVRGAAVVAAADLLFAQRLTQSYAKALLIAVDLLRHETPEVCETLTTLLSDGWEDGLGAAIHTSRTL